jgi:hypothetical protein
MKKQLLWLPAVALAVALAGQVGFYRYLDVPITEAHASWSFSPKDLKEARDHAPTIVEGDVVSVAAGPDIVTPAKGEPNDEDRIPTQHVQLKVSKVHKGNAKAGQVLDLFQTGGYEIPTDKADGKQGGRLQTHIVLLSGDPLYKVGERYLLMLEDGPRNQLRTISPEGRFRIESNGNVTPMVDNQVTSSVKGKALGELQRQVAPAANGA